jgi:hypothetical protein
MPAWSVPGCHSVSSPRIRCQRVRMSCSVLLKAWPMCREPVTFGGGIITEKAGWPGLALAPAAKALASSHSFEIRASASAALKVFSIGIRLVKSLTVSTFALQNAKHCALRVTQRCKATNLWNVRRAGANPSA